MKEDKIFLAQIEDKLQQCQNNYMAVYTGFMDLRQKSMAQEAVEPLRNAYRDVNIASYGGYENAERSVMLFLPDYADIADVNPLCGIRIINESQGKTLSHGDYLGSLTGLGIKREMIGDILVRDTGADVVVMKEIRDFVLMNYGKAGRNYVSAAAIEVEALLIPELKTKIINDTIASLRLDNVIASGFSLSRSKAAEAIKRGIVFVNSRQIEKIDSTVNQGDKLVLRGKGKAVLKEVGGRSRKDRIIVVIEKYV